MQTITHQQAFDLLKKYNKDSFHIQHALTVEAVMKWYANELGYGEDAEYWGIVGLLHDIDFELYPAEHCLKAPELLRKQALVRMSFMQYVLMAMELRWNVVQRSMWSRSMKWKKYFLRQMSLPV